MRKLSLLHCSSLAADYTRLSRCSCVVLSVAAPPESLPSWRKQRTRIRKKSPLHDGSCFHYFGREGPDSARSSTVFKKALATLLRAVSAVRSCGKRVCERVPVEGASIAELLRWVLIPPATSFACVPSSDDPGNSAHLEFVDGPDRK